MLLINLFIKINFIKYSLNSLGAINKKKSNFCLNFPREDAYICLQISYISLDLEVVINDETRNVDNDQIALVSMGLVDLFSEAKLTTYSEKHLENITVHR